MSTITRPVGTRDPQVYWRRRVVALVVLAVVVALVVWGVTSVVGALRGGDTPTDPAAQQGAEQPAADEPVVDPAPEESAGTDPAASGEPGACAPEQLAVVPTTDVASYALGSTAKVGMTITNTGAAACTMDAGSAALELLVVSGTDRIWSSDDCQTGAENRPTQVEPGEAGMLASTVEWNLTRSAEGCAEGLPALKAGTYQLTARAGDITSAPVAFQITG